MHFYQTLVMGKNPITKSTCETNGVFPSTGCSPFPTKFYLLSFPSLSVAALKCCPRKATSTGVVSIVLSALRATRLGETSREGQPSRTVTFWIITLIGAYSIRDTNPIPLGTPDRKPQISPTLATSTKRLPSPTADEKRSNVPYGTGSRLFSAILFRGYCRLDGSKMSATTKLPSPLSGRPTTGAFLQET